MRCQAIQIDDFNLIKFLIQPYLAELSQIIEESDNSLALIKDIKYFNSYFSQKNKKAFACYLHDDDTISGFALVNKVGLGKTVDWNMGEFFIAKEFRRQYIGRNFALNIFRNLPGEWQVPVLPKNKNAIQFWRETILALLQTEIEPITIFASSDNKPRILFNFLLKPS